MDLSTFDRSFTPTVDHPPPPPPAQRPTPQQEALYAAVGDSTAHVTVEAVAGAGKTTSAVEAARVARGRVGFVAFNKHIAAELQERLGGAAKACTLHALGFAAVRRAFRDCALDEQKPHRILERLRPRWMTTTTRGRIVWYEEGTATLALARLAKLTLADGSDESLAALADHYGVDDATSPVFEAVREVLAAAANQTAVIDFDDMVWLPVRLGLPVERFDVLLVDEAQDLSTVQHALVRRAADRLVAIGDRHQCQPAGTLVSITGGGAKPIEQIAAGDQIVSFDRRGAAVVGRNTPSRKVEQVASRHYDGHMFTIEVGERTTYCTPNHRWVARFNTRETDLWVTYLMRKGNWYRLGWCQLFDAKGGLHLGARSRIERAEAAWILSVHRNKTDASANESYLAARFGLCLLPFMPVDGAAHITTDVIRQVFGGLEEEGMEDRARKCLAWHGRDPEHPFYRTDFQQCQGRTTIFETQTSNLIPEIMSLPVYTGDVSALWSPITTCTAEAFCGTVYSLKVQDYETYVADGIITHNSIYGFSGSDPQSLPNLVAAIGAESRGVRECPLTVTFRCPRSHVELARKIVPQIEAAAAAIDGTVATIEPGRLTGAVKPGDLVVCRVNAPLVSLAFKLIRAGVPAKMLGRDIGKGQVTLIDQLRADSAIDLIHKARDWQERETARLERRDAAASRIQAVADRAECLIELASAAPTVSELRRQIDTLFADQAESGRVVTLASVHRAKGSEADRVFIAAPDRMPLRFDGDRRNGPPKVRPWELEQEFNLLYVAVTRAKKELTFAGPMPSVLCS